MQPGTGLTARPDDADVRADGGPDTEVHPAELPSGVAAADGELASQGPVADADLDPCADRVRIRSALGDPEREPVAHGARIRCVAAADVAPQPNGSPVADLDQVE